jgi:hypothetical protein
MIVSDTLVSVLNSARRFGWRRRTLLREGTARRAFVRTRVALALTVLLVPIAAGMTPGAVAASNPGAPAAPAAPAATPQTEALCGPAAPGYASCLSRRRTDIAARARSQIASLASPSGYGPADLQSAYALGPASSGGSGETVAVVDAYDQPNAEADLAAYRAQYGLSACSTANGCFRKVNQSGGSSYPAADSGWGAEIDLDIEMVSAVCPNCHILLVEASSNSISDLGAAVGEAVALGAVAVSNSYGAGEWSGETGYDSYYNYPGVAVTASSGDGGYGVEYPAASPNVVAVGGTSLSKASNSRGWTETAWSGAGSGCSAYESKATWQTDAGCAKRTVADVSAVADPYTGVAVYDDYGYGGWLVFGGTSVASPIIASTYALAGTPAKGTHPGSYPYANRASLNDVTSGSNGSCSPSYLCKAGLGYDGPTGLGTPKGTAAFTPTTQATVPGAPTSVTAVAGNAQATVSFTPPASSGGSPITSYTVTSSPGGQTATGTASPITVTGLANGTPYTFTVHATNVVGSGPESSPSNSVTPTTPLTIMTTSLAAGRLNRSYSATLKATGGISPYTWTITSGALPLGLKLGASTGTISGTPTSTGTFSFTVSVGDSSKPTSQTKTKTFSITISRR